MSAESFSNHRNWILQLRQSEPAKRTHGGSLADDLAMQLTGADLSPGSGNSSSFAGHYSTGSIGFDSLAFESDMEVLDDEPVYRSLGFFCGDGSDEVVADDEPVYRSLGEGADAGAGSDSDAAEEQWLASMPPLVCRQREVLDFSIP